MALRGVVNLLAIFPEDYGPGATPSYAFQNHFENPYTFAGITYTHNFFSSAGYESARDTSYPELSINFGATAANVDLVEELVEYRRFVTSGLFRWTATEGIDNPVTIFPLALHAGSVVGADSDFTSLTVKVALYNNAVSADLPWRKIPWTILGPLSFRR